MMLSGVAEGVIGDMMARDGAMVDTSGIVVFEFSWSFLRNAIRCSVFGINLTDASLGKMDVKEPSI